MLKRLVKYVVTANVSSEHYQLAKDDMYKNNVMMLRLLSTIAVSIFALCSVLGLTIQNMHSKLITYVVGMAFSVAVLLTAVFSHNQKLHTACMFLFDVMLLSIGLLITLVSAPEQLTVTLIPVALLVPLFFDVKPIVFLTIEMLADCVYVIGALRVKPAELLVLDMVDVLAFSFAGIIIGTAITKVKIERYVYAKRIHEIALCDGLTKCYNRKSYTDDTALLTNEYPADFVYISLDVNGLKVVNDSLGHEAGDEIILGASQCMQRVFGLYGKVYRTGGDEFTVIAYTGKTSIEKIVSEFEDEVAGWHGKLVDCLSVSLGYVKAEDVQGLPINEVAARSDKNMYASKSAYYRKKGVDRRGQTAAYTALCGLYTKILKIDLTTDTYSVVSMDVSEQIADKGFDATISGWLKGFGTSGQVYEDDLQEYMKKTDIDFLKKYFDSGKPSISISYRRKDENGFKQVAMEIIPTIDYTSENQTVFLYVKKTDA